jgi:hypothetical protein
MRTARSLAAWLVLGAALPCGAQAQSPGPRLYETTIETGLPHLEENLRYATTRTRLCLGEKQLASAFPVLQHEALKGCRLDNARHEGSEIAYVLSCTNGTGTLGTARWRIEDAAIFGTLDVRLGGKNMTFYQRIAGRLVGPCTPEE